MKGGFCRPFITFVLGIGKLISARHNRCKVGHARKARSPYLAVFALVDNEMFFDSALHCHLLDWHFMEVRARNPCCSSTPPADRNALLMLTRFRTSILVPGKRCRFRVIEPAQNDDAHIAALRQNFRNIESVADNRNVLVLRDTVSKVRHRRAAIDENRIIGFDQRCGCGASLRFGIGMAVFSKSKT